MFADIPHPNFPVEHCKPSVINPREKNKIPEYPWSILAPGFDISRIQIVIDVAASMDRFFLVERAKPDSKQVELG